MDWERIPSTFTLYSFDGREVWGETSERGEVLCMNLGRAILTTRDLPMESRVEKSANPGLDSDLTQDVPLPVLGSYPVPEADIAARVQALESILLEKGLLSSDAIDKVVRGLRKRHRPDAWSEGRSSCLEIL